MTKLKLPTNLGFSRSITPSNAVFMSYSSEDSSNKRPLEISEVTSVGTISNYSDIHKDNGKNIENANIQTVDVCYLPGDHDSIEMSFTVAFSSESIAPHACNDHAFRSAIKEFTAEYKNKGGYEYLADLYLKNIFDAKMLWRNGLADDVTVNVKAMRTELSTVNDINNDEYSELVKNVGCALSGERKRIVLKVVITGWLGDGQAVYPSEEFVQKSTDKGAKSKTLARTSIADNNNIAAMHPQKVGNAIRQIDTWYDGFEDLGKALAVDPACVNKTEFKAYRLKSTKRDLYSLMQNNTLPFIEELKLCDSALNVSNDIHFIVANLIRGGVFGGK